MNRISRAWAVLQPYLTMPDWRDDTIAKLQAETRMLTTELKIQDDANEVYERLNTSLRASLDDARAEVTRLSAQAKRRDGLMREAHALLGRAITDDGVPQP